jgi:predicted RNA-binding Zn-ribbon protein involved in translation (DUF1610 family)
MSGQNATVRWAPRLRRHELRRLYESEARGLLDEELVNDVGLTLYLRCKSILAVEQAKKGGIRCPGCGATFRRQDRRDEAERLQCPSCDWEMSWRDFARTFKRKQLNAGGAGEAFRLFIQQWELTRTATERMLLIDRLIHAFHVRLFGHLQDPQPTRSVCPNLIEGTLSELIPFLDSLAYGDGNIPPRDTHGAWQEALRSIECFYADFATRPRGSRRMRDGD